MAKLPMNILEEVQQARPATGPDRRGIVQGELPPDPTLPQVRVELTDSTGYVQVYHVEDQDVRVIPRSVLVSVLEKRLPDGRRAFTTQIPDHLPDRGPRFMCPLNPDSPGVDLFKSRGFPVCNVDSLRTEMDVQLHLEHKHKAAWRWSESERQRSEHAAQLETQRLLTQAIEKLSKRG